MEILIKSFVQEWHNLLLILPRIAIAIMVLIFFKGFTLSSNVTSSVDIGGRLPVDLRLSDQEEDNVKERYK